MSNQLDTALVQEWETRQEYRSVPKIVLNGEQDEAVA
jgi:hypothetical protein